VVCPVIREADRADQVSSAWGTTSHPAAAYRGHMLVPRRADLALAAVVAVTGLAEIYAGNQGGRHPTLNAMLVLVGAAVMTLRSRVPLACLAAYAALGLLVQLPTVGVQLTAALFVGCLLLLGTVSRYYKDPQAVCALLATVLVLGIGSLLSHRAWDILVVVLGCGAAWTMGRLLRHEAVRSSGLSALAAELSEEGEARASEAVQSERIRIARELHDSVAHTVSLMTLHVGGVRRGLEGDPSRVEDTQMLSEVEAWGREAVAELHRVVGVLRTADPVLDQATELAPQPRLADVSALVDRVTAAGMPVELVVEGTERPLPPGLDLAAYRIVQEAVTNALKHAPGAALRVYVAYDADALRLQVDDDGPTAQGRDALEAVGGHGLPGMRERAAMYGGRVEAGPRPGRGFRVRATVPLAEPS
jgi:signal transduction histidine kinase